MLQDTAQSYSIWQSDGTGKPQTVRAVGQVVPGWIDLSDGRRGVTLGMCHMREMHGCGGDTIGAGHTLNEFA